jgi:hypothetical protein
VATSLPTLRAIPKKKVLKFLSNGSISIIGENNTPSPKGVPMCSFETLVIAACSMRVASDDTDAYAEVIAALETWVWLTREQEAFLEATLKDFGLASLEV